MSLAIGQGNFAAPAFKLSAFGANAGGWSSQDVYPRTLGDVNGDHMADIIGFGAAGVHVSLATGNGNFAAPVLALHAFGTAGGWNSQEQVPRHVADVNDDGMADLVAFGSSSVMVALAIGGGAFTAPISDVTGFGLSGGWTSQNVFPRQLADINGDDIADIVGFGAGGVYAALAGFDLL